VQIGLHDKSVIRAHLLSAIELSASNGRAFFLDAKYDSAIASHNACVKKIPIDSPINRAHDAAQPPFDTQAAATQNPLKRRNTRRS
jgi:hypothetical protein